MRTFKQNPHLVEASNILRVKETRIGETVRELEEWDEEFTELPVPAPTLKSSFLKIQRTVSEKLFSIELGKISF